MAGKGLEIYFFYRIFAKIRVPTRLPHFPRAMAASAADSLEIEEPPASPTVAAIDELTEDADAVLVAVVKQRGRRMLADLLDEAENKRRAHKREGSKARHDKWIAGLKARAALVTPLQEKLATATARADAAESRAFTAETKLLEAQRALEQREELEELEELDVPGAAGYSGDDGGDVVMG